MRDTGQSTRQPSALEQLNGLPASSGSRIICKPRCTCKQDHVQAFGLYSEDIHVCSKQNRPQPDRGEQVTVSSMEQDHVCIPCQPTSTALLLFPEQLACSSSNRSAYICKGKGKVRPYLVDLPGEAYEAAAFQGGTACHH